jgi:uncharacterized membrane protein YbhN (UPF0104 family)
MESWERFYHVVQQICGAASRRTTYPTSGHVTLNEMRAPQSRFGVISKVLFGAAIFAWMAWSGKLDLAQVVKAIGHWPLMLTIVACGYGQVALTAWRWNLLLRAQQICLSFRRAWGLMMIGMLFNVVIPGAVGGDLIKGYYITSAAPARKSHAATSVLVDRVVGLIGLLFLGAVMALANWHETLRSPATRSLGTLTVGGFLGGLAGLYVALLAGSRLAASHLVPKVLRGVFRALHEYHRQAAVVPIALALSVFNHTLTCAMYYLALQATGVTSLPMSQFFLIVPLGLVTSAIPISPAGVGVGQAAFFALFRIVAPAYATTGTEALTVFQLMVILICLSGMYWYLSYKHSAVEAVADAGVI